VVAEAEGGVSDATGRVLIGCPTYAGKEYSLDAWLKGVRSQTYEPKSIYTVDNTRISPAYYELLKRKGIDCSHLVPWPDWDRTFYRCWQLILERATALGCYWVFSVEADNVAAPESLEKMVNIALLSNTHLVTHACPMHKVAAEAAGIPEWSYYYNELGCTLISRQLLERAIEEFEEYGHMVPAIWGSCERYHGGYVKLTNLFKVEHLDGYEMSFDNLGPSEMPGLIFPGAMPSNCGTEKPQCLA
jgi:hypothetical protein